MPWAVAGLALPALTVLSGLQLLRLMVATVVSVHRDRLGAPLAGLALFVLLVVGLGFLAAPVARRLGRGHALVVAAAGVALVRLVVQLVPDALARWLLAPAGVVLFLWFVPLWLARGSPEDRDGRGFGLALLVGLALDTALTGLGGGWDYAWSISAWTVALAVLLAGAALWALAALPDPVPGPPGRRVAAVLPLAGLGPARPGWGRWPPPGRPAWGSSCCWCSPTTPPTTWSCRPATAGSRRWRPSCSGWPPPGRCGAAAARRTGRRAAGPEGATWFRWG
ncbi:MAG TPA: hypothetical protein VND02_01180 [Actinomycetota bacterium]|nr:hypothetical protein [Actinomycetota bacterium]